MMPTVMQVLIQTPALVAEVPVEVVIHSLDLKDLVASRVEMDHSTSNREDPVDKVRLIQRNYSKHSSAAAGVDDHDVTVVHERVPIYKCMSD